MTAEEFWSSTPREFAAHAKLLDRGHSMLASLLAARHNGPMIRRDEKPWIYEMFMPGYEPPKSTPELLAAKSQLDFELLRGRMHKPTPKELEMQRSIAQRMARGVREVTAGTKSIDAADGFGSYIDKGSTSDAYTNIKGIEARRQNYSKDYYR